MSSAPDLSGLPDWARDALEASMRSEEPPAKSVLDHRGGPAWDLLVDAAVVTSFLPKDLGHPDLSERSDSEKAVLSFAEPTHEPEGVRWSLTREARRAILGATIPNGEAAAAASRTAKGFSDPISHALRECITSRSGPRPESADLGALEATRVALSWLTGIGGLDLPLVEDLDREIELRRLLAQFERMVGQVPGAGGSARPDRFFGRDKEIEDLREYVGVLPAGSLLALGARLVTRATRVITGRTPKCVWGTGGVGKTTLIAKFMLEHVRAAESRYPFAYLDFDRTTISARDRAGLLAEMCLQVGAQFRELNGSMTELRGRVRELAVKMAASPSGEMISLLVPYALELRGHVDRHLGELESTFEWARPFLLVFDTFEVVQYTPADVLGLEDFVRAFSLGKEEVWPRCRIILSGRKKVTEFLGKVEGVELGPLDPKGSAEMLAALAGDAGKPIPLKEAEKLVQAIAKGVGEKSDGVRPLRLRLVGEVFRQMKGADGAAVVKSLLDELSHPPSKDGLAGRIFVDGILVRRILGHVSDPRVRALADPGLVVRRITVDVLREVMARGTPKPGVDGEDPGDPDEIEPWILDEAEAGSIFAAFEKEVRLVEADGDALRHRQDVRQEMLPLIRARRPKRFQALHRLAFDFFRARAESTPGDSASAAEAVYHGLWLGEPLPELDRLWRGGPGFDPRIDPDEFAAGTPANVYVRAKAKDRLEPKEIELLPREVALEWLSAHKAELSDRQRLEATTLAEIRAVAGDDYSGLDESVDLAAVVARLLYRDGLWHEARALIDRHMGPQTVVELASQERSRSGKLDPRAESLLSLLRTWATVAGKTGAVPQQLLTIFPIAAKSGLDRVVRVEILAHIAVGLRQTDLKLLPSRELKHLIDSVARPVSLDQWSRSPRILRLAILTGAGNVRELLAVFLSTAERPPRDLEVAGTVRRLLSEALGSASGPVEDFFAERQESPEASAELDRFWRNALPTLQTAARERADLTAEFWRLVAFQHSDWVHPLGNALARALRDPGHEVIHRSLEEHGFLRPPRGRKSQSRVPDGHTIVQWAVDQGRLLQLAGALPELATLVPEPPASTPPGGKVYPRRVYGVANALVRWHHTIVEVIGPPETEELAQEEVVS